MDKIKKNISKILLFLLLFSQFSFVKADNSITSEEQKKVQSAIIDLQLQLLDSSKTITQKITQEIEKNSNFEEKGDISFMGNFNMQGFGSGNVNVSLNNYNLTQSLFDYEMSGTLSGATKLSSSYNSFTGSVSTLFTLIQKNSDIFGKLQNFTGSTDNKEISNLIDQIKEYFPENQFVKYSDENSQVFFDTLKNFNLNAFFQQADNYGNKALLEAYKKDEEKYFLIPTRHACNAYFDISNSLGKLKSWYEPTSCTDTIYKKLINEVKKGGNFYITLGESYNTIGFESKENNEHIKFSLSYNENNIGMLQGEIIDKKNKNNYMKINYLRNKFLNINFFDMNSKSKFNFNSKIQDGKISEIRSNINIPETVKGNFAFVNNTFAGKYFFYEKESEYNYDTMSYDEEKISKTYGMVLFGKTKNGALSQAQLLLKGKNKEGKEFVNFSLEADDATFDYRLNVEDNYSMFEAQGEGNYTKTSAGMDGEFKLSSYYDDRLIENFGGNFEITVDETYPKSDFFINFTANMNGENVLSLEMKKTAQRNFKENIIIEAPTDYIDFEETDSLYD